MKFKGRLDIPTKQWNYYSLLQWRFSKLNSKWPTCFKLIDPKYIQNIQNICKEDLAKKSLTEDTHTYTDIKMIKIQKTSRFFYAPFLFWNPWKQQWQLHGTNIQNILWCLYWTIYTILLRPAGVGEWYHIIHTQVKLWHTSSQIIINL